MDWGGEAGKSDARLGYGGRGDAVERPFGRCVRNWDEHAIPVIVGWCGFRGGEQAADRSPKI